MAKSADDAHVGAAPAVDRLIVVADHAQVARLGGERAHQPILDRVGVLEFVDQHVAKARAQLAARRAQRILRDPHHVQNQILEIDRARGEQRALIPGIDLEQGRIETAADVDVFGPAALAFFRVDPRKHPARQGIL